MTLDAPRWATAALLLAITFGAVVARAEDLNPAGKWVLINDWGWPSEKAIVEVRMIDSRLTARLVDGPPNQRPTKVRDFVYRDAHVQFSLVKQGAKPQEFDGTLVTEGQFAGQFVGTLRGHYLDPARLRRTEAEQLAESQRPPYQNQIEAAHKATDQRERVAKQIGIIRQHPGPETNFLFRQVLSCADATDLAVGQVDELLQTWLANAEPYGSAFIAEARLVILRSLRGQKKFAPLALDVAERARREVGPLTSAEDQASLLHFLAEAARLSGQDAKAVAAERQAGEIDARLDADYRRRVPPFTVEPYAGRTISDANRVVLLELFTGALCPPCVAADVACDAVGSAFKPSEVIVLQYHVNIPGADPLTNSSTIARQKYYEIRGVPESLFNGAPWSSGGGDMAAAEAKYHEYRQRIEPLLAEKRSADIELTVKRSGDTLTIRAIADAATDEAVQPHANNDDADPASQFGLRLRIVLTEDLVRHDGGNGVRLNHHVVRDFLGDVSVTLLEEGRAAIELSADLGDVRRRLNEYSRTHAQRLAVICPRPLPKPLLEHLAIVVFVQDDANKQVLHAVQMAVPEE